MEQEAAFDKVVKNTVVSQDSGIVASDTKWVQKEKNTDVSHNQKAQ